MSQHSFRPIRTTLALLAVVAFMPVTTTAFAEDTLDKKAGKDRSCIHVSSINGFNPIDNKHLTVSVGANKTYLVTLFNRCHDLRWAEQISVNATMSWSCSNSRDQIIVDGQRCLISNIELVSSREEAKDLVSDAKDKGN